MNNHRPAQSWSPTDRRLWLAKHGAPDNFVLLTALEVTAIQNGLESEHRARMALQEEVKADKAKLEDYQVALNKAIDTIRIWHGDGPDWPIYLEHSPEMKAITAPLKL